MNNPTDLLSTKLQQLALLEPSEDRLQAVLLASKPVAQNSAQRTSTHWFLAAASVAIMALGLYFGVYWRSHLDVPSTAEILAPTSPTQPTRAQSDELEILLRTSQQLEHRLADMNVRRASLRQLESLNRAHLPLTELDARFSQHRDPEILRERIRVMQDVQTGQFDAAFYLVD
jgi:hypothetical protein